MASFVHWKSEVYRELGMQVTNEGEWGWCGREEDEREEGRGEEKVAQVPKWEGGWGPGWMLMSGPTEIREHRSAGQRVSPAWRGKAI
jgi:hypothetical protein